MALRSALSFLSPPFPTGQATSSPLPLRPVFALQVAPAALPGLTAVGQQAQPPPAPPRTPHLCPQDPHGEGGVAPPGGDVT